MATSKRTTSPRSTRVKAVVAAKAPVIDELADLQQQVYKLEDELGLRHMQIDDTATLRERLEILMARAERDKTVRILEKFDTETGVQYFERVSA